MAGLMGGALGGASRWDSARADTYDQAWDRLEKNGVNPHGEADFVESFAPSSVLDAGCGTGRVAIELSERGIATVGVDVDGAMLAVARRKAPQIEWVEAGIEVTDLGRRFDLVVMAGNVILFVVAGTEASVVAGACSHVLPGGHLVAGFSLGRSVSMRDWESWVIAAGLTPVARYSTWNSDRFLADSNYLVSVSLRQTGQA